MSYTLGARVLRSKTEEFPYSILDSGACYGLLGDFVRAIDPHTEVDPVALLTQFLVAFGNVIGRNPHFCVESDKHSLNLFMVLVGQSAKGRKGTSWGHIRKLFSLCEKSWVENNITNGLSSGEGLIKALSPKKMGDETKDEEQDKRLLVQEGEFAVVLQVMKRDGNTLSSLLRNAWDTGYLNTLTRNDPLKVAGAHVSIIGHITKDELLRHLNGSEATNGFANRFLWVFSRRSKLLPDGGNISEVDFYPLQQNLKRAIEFARRTGEMRRDKQANDYWREIYGELSLEIPGLLGSVTARAEAQTMRLACLYALLDCSTNVRKVHLEAAFALWRYCFDSARYIFGNSLGDTNADKIISALENAGNEGLTTTQISNLLGRNLPAAQLRRTLETLVSEGHIQSEKKQSTQGRPSEVWCVTPEPEPAPQKVEAVSTELPTSTPLQSPAISSSTQHEINEENEELSSYSSVYEPEELDDYFSRDDDYEHEEEDYDESDENEYDDEDIKEEEEEGYNSRSRAFRGYEEEEYLR